MTSTVCSNHNIIAMNPDTVKLAELFCSCPAAKKAIDSLSEKISILLEKGPFPNPRVAVLGDKDSSERTAHIQIPQESKDKKKIQVLSHLTYELFNAQNSGQFEALVKQGDRGELGMEEFARATEEIEHQAHAGRNRIFSQCAKIWDVAKDPLLEKFQGKPVSLQMYLWETETSCHTDSIRKRWIGRHQKSYCKKRPEDTRSCKARKSDFCDFSEVQAMPKAKKEAFIHERKCSLLNTFLSTDIADLAREAAEEEGCPTPRSEL